jgi:hypothetical protein
MTPFWTTTRSVCDNSANYTIGFTDLQHLASMNPLSVYGKEFHVPRRSVLV